jgi:hypothetical protein
VFLLESAERSEAVVSPSGSLATHVTESWVPHLEVTPVGKTVQSLRDQIIDEALANTARKQQKEPLNVWIDSDASQESPS